MIDKINFESILNGTLSGIISGFILFLLGIVFLDKKRILKPWIYKVLDRRIYSKLREIISFLIKFVVHPYLRLFLSLILILSLNYGYNKALSSLFLILITWSFIKKEKKVKSLPVAEFSDGFKNLEDWSIKDGSPEIKKDFGKPEPSLNLKFDPNEKNNSVVFLKNIRKKSAVIECDFYLEENAIFNIVFFANTQDDRWYMARYDSRGRYSDGFIIKDGGLGYTWRNHILSGTKTSSKEWHRARLEFNESKVSMYKDNILIAEFENPNLFGSQIGIFNEVGDVYVDNFLLIDKE